MFIVFEGLDGSGSSTQAEKLREFFDKKWRKVLKTKEPNEDSPTWILIRNILQKKEKLSSKAFQVLFCADRFHHLESKILPALNDWKIVISDRYFFSTIAFWGLDWHQNILEKISEDFKMPDFVFLLKLKPEKCIKRIEKRWNDFELFEEKEKLEKIWETYEKLSEKHKKIFYVLDAEKSIEEIFWEVVEIISK